MSDYNKDILYFIFQELQDNSKALFSCLMVNKNWCETAIPILWRDPWRYNIDYSNSNLYDIIFICLSDETKKFLVRKGLSPITIISPFSPISPNPHFKSLSFDYLSLCKSINVDIISNITSSISSIPYDQFILQQEIYNILITKCIELKYLDMRSIKHQIFYFPKAWTSFESLYELIGDTSLDSSYFYGLASICKRIQRLIIINKNINVNLGVASLIKTQKNLKYFKWRDDFNDDCFVGDPYKEILFALLKKVDNLYHLEMFFQYIYLCEYGLLQEVLPKFRKLKSLVIENFCFFTEVKLKTLIYHDLEILRIDHITLNTVSKIIENSRGHIKEILLKYNYKDNFGEDSLAFMRNICVHCPLIERLTLVFSSSEKHFKEFENLLRSCQNLKSLLIIITSPTSEKENEDNESEESEDEENEQAEGNEYKENGENEIKLLEILIKFAPKNLKEIRFFNDFRPSLEILEEFLERWKGRQALSIITCDYTYERNDYVSLINKYKDNGVIKEFICDSERNVYF